MQCVGLHNETLLVNVDVKDGAFPQQKHHFHLTKLTNKEAGNADDRQEGRKTECGTKGDAGEKKTWTPDKESQ